MSITDELREWTANFFRLAPTATKELTAIADRIDAAHRAALEKLAAGVDEDDDGSVDLPEGHDGDYIRVGDMLDGYGKTIEVVELRYGRSGWVIISRDGNAYADNYAFTHHRTDTWERIIEDALDGYHDTDFEALVARCKALAEVRTDV